MIDAARLCRSGWRKRQPRRRQANVDESYRPKIWSALHSPPARARSPRGNSTRGRSCGVARSSRPCPASSSRGTRWLAGISPII